MEWVGCRAAGLGRRERAAKRAAQTGGHGRRQRRRQRRHLQLLGGVATQCGLQRGCCRCCWECSGAVGAPLQVGQAHRLQELHALLRALTDVADQWPMALGSRDRLHGLPRCSFLTRQSGGCAPSSRPACNRGAQSSAPAAPEQLAPRKSRQPPPLGAARCAPAAPALDSLIAAPGGHIRGAAPCCQDLAPPPLATAPRHTAPTAPAAGGRAAAWGPTCPRPRR